MEDTQVIDLDHYQTVVEAHFEAKGLKIMADRYSQKGETAAETFWRVASVVAGKDRGEIEWRERAVQYMDKLLVRNLFLPNTPTFTGAGTPLGQLAACFVLPIEDNMECIFGTLRDAALIQKTGGGTGFTFGHLRAKGTAVHSSGGVSSGPVSFMDAYNHALGAVAQGGCLEGNTLVHTNRGTLRLSELVNEDKQGWSDIKEEGDVKVILGTGEHRVAGGYNNGSVSRRYEIMNSYGTLLCGTGDHKVQKLQKWIRPYLLGCYNEIDYWLQHEEEEEQWEWVKLMEVRPGDLIRTVKGAHRGIDDTGLSSEEAYAMGILMKGMESNRVYETTASRTHSLFARIGLEHFLKREDDPESTSDTVIEFAEGERDNILKWMLSKGATEDDITNRRAPLIIRRSNAMVLGGFLLGLCMVHNGNYRFALYHNSNESIVQEIGVLFNGLGHIAQFGKGYDGTGSSMVHHMALYMPPERSPEWWALLDQPKAKDEAVPVMSVRAIDGKEETTLDLAVEGSHSYLANGYFSHNSRRGANMGMLPVDHPDIREFVTCKTREGSFSNFNISVALNSEFMQAALENKKWPLRDTDGSVIAEDDAADLLSLIIKCAWNNGEPGVVFMDRINADNPVPSLFKIEATNPCLTSDTVIDTDKGPKMLMELVGKDFRCPNGVLVPGGFYQSSLVTETIEVTTKNGHMIRCTPNHLLRVRTDSRGNCAWKAAGDLLQRIDFLCLKAGIFSQNDEIPPEPDDHIDFDALARDLVCGAVGNDDFAVLANMGCTDIIALIRCCWIYSGRPKSCLYVSGKCPRKLVNLLQGGLLRLGVITFVMFAQGEYVFTPDQCCMWFLNEVLTAPDIHSAIRIVSAWHSYHPAFFDDYAESVEKVVLKKSSQMEPVFDATCEDPMSPLLWANNFVTHNCSEIPLSPYESCCLGSINLSNHVTDEKVNWSLLERTIDLSVKFLNDVIDSNKFVDAVPMLKMKAHRTKRIGLGIMGLADMFFKMKLRYGSAEAVSVASQVMEFIRYHSMLTSANLAVRSGKFADFAYSRFADEQSWPTPQPIYPVMERLFGVKPVHVETGRPELSWEWLKYIIARTGLRNLGLTCVAPTGTISLLAGVSGFGAEPVFALAHKRRMLNRDGTCTERLMTVPGLHETLMQLPNGDAVVEQLLMEGSLSRIKEEVPEAIKNVYVSASDISVKEHVLMQAALQCFVDAAISKTVNMPNTSTEQDVKDVFELAWRSGCKGICVYRTGSRTLEVLKSGSK